MLCQNCGRQVEFIGNVCAWCGAPKIQSQSIHLFANIFGIGLGLLGGFIGSKVNEEYGMIVGALIGLVVGVLLGYNKGAQVGTQNGAARRGENANRTDCPHCGYRTSFNVAQNPDKYCANCGKRFGG